MLMMEQAMRFQWTKQNVINDNIIYFILNYIINRGLGNDLVVKMGLLCIHEYLSLNAQYS